MSDLAPESPYVDRAAVVEVYELLRDTYYGSNKLKPAEALFKSAMFLSKLLGLEVPTGTETVSPPAVTVQSDCTPAVETVSPAEAIWRGVEPAPAPAVVVAPPVPVRGWHPSICERAAGQKCDHKYANQCVGQTLSILQEIICRCVCHHRAND